MCLSLTVCVYMCAQDWKELWLMDCYWHILFCIILFVIMMIWRPSANKLR